ncbi:MAG: ATP-grasp domain-containing protein [Acidimicrobiia bacterium]|nr:ATP-grasp domain-containing protein [Acidimicrobiia bacterium]
MPRVLLLLPTTTYRARDFLDAADSLDIEIVIGSDGRQTLEDLMGQRALVLPLGGGAENDVRASVAAIADANEKTPFDAIVGVDDGGIVVAAAASDRLGLPANDVAAVRRTRDKREQRSAFSAAEVPQPEYTALDPDDVRRLLAGERLDQIDHVTFPAVLKPPELSGSQGVIRVDAPGEMRAAAQRIVDIIKGSTEETEECSPGSGALVLEEFVAGPEVAVEAVVRSGNVRVLAVFDKPDPLDGPYFEETIYVTPSRHSDRDLRDLERVVAIGVGALGITEGPVHAEARLGDRGVRLLEVAARSIGGLCARALRFGVGVTLEEVILRHALELPVPVLVPEGAASGVMMLPIPHAGTLREVRGVDEARAVPGVVGLETTIPVGSAVVPLPEGDRYLGFLFGRGDDPAEVEDTLRRAHARLEIEIS